MLLRRGSSERRQAALSPREATVPLPCSASSSLLPHSSFEESDNVPPSSHELDAATPPTTSGGAVAVVNSGSADAATAATQQCVPPAANSSVFSLMHRIFHDFFDSSDKRRLATAVGALALSSATNLAFPTIIGRGIDLAVRSASPARPRVCLAAAVGIFGVGAVASWLRVYSFKSLQYSVEQKMRRAFFGALLQQDIEYLTSHQAGDLTTRLLQDIEAGSIATSENIAHVLRGLNSSIGGTAMLMLISARLAFLTLALVPVLGVGLIVYRKRTRALAQRLREEIGSAMAFGNERLNNIETVRLFSMEQFETATFAEKLDNLTASSRKVASADGFMMGGMALSMNLALLVVVCFGGTLVRKRVISTGNLASFTLYSSMVGLGFSSLSKVYGELLKSAVSIQRVYEILDRVPPALPMRRTLLQVKGKIVFDNVSFAYKCRPTVQVLNQFNLSIFPDEIVALAGSSGTGKTTVCRLLTRLLDPTSGRILLDEQPLSILDPQWLRDEVFSVVNQEPVLFDATIYENIAYGRKNATALEVEEAARKANAHDFILSLPLMYSTRVGEGGVQLSCGQKQRVAIARALLKNTPCLILDEATSALDPENQQLVQEALCRLIQGRTVLVVAHDPAMFHQSTSIAAMANGHIVEMGTFKDLKAKPHGEFARIIKSACSE